MRIALVLTLIAACSSDPPPSCAEAGMHYYSVGCQFDDSTGAMIPESEFITGCQQAAVAAPSNCTGALDDWLTCLDAVKGGNNAACDCSQQQMTLLGCK